MRTHELRTCPACNAGNAVPFEICPHTRLQRCPSCSLVFALEYGDPEEIYVDGYLSGKSDFGLDIMHPEFQEFLESVAVRRLKAIEKVVAPPGRFLDVGCGSGEVLAVAQRRGWEVTGVEPVEESVRIARERRGLDVRQALLQQSGLPEHAYDVVSAFHVLEHMPNGADFLTELARWVRPGGAVVIEVPNFRSFHRRNHGASWSGLRPLEHVAHYTPATLASALTRTGIVPRSITTPTYLYEGQTLDQALDDLGLHRLNRQASGLIGRPGEQRGEATVAPSPFGWRLLKGVGRAYDLARTGQVILAVGIVPQS